MEIGIKYLETKNRIVSGLINESLKLNLLVNNSREYVDYFNLEKILDEVYYVSFDNYDIMPLSKKTLMFIDLVKNKKMKFIDGNFVSLN